MRPYYDDGRCVIYHGDCREVLPTLAPDVVVTDPPYGTGGWRRDGSGQGRNPSGRSERHDWDVLLTDWLRPVPTLTFWSMRHLLPLLAAAADIGLTKQRCLHMRKRDPMPSQTGVTAWSVEHLWSLSPEDFYLRGGTDWISVSTPRLGRDVGATGHPYEKPIEALTWAIGKCPAGLVVDPFMGSGTTLVAAKALGYPSTGIEADEQWCEVAARRLSQEVLDFGAAS